MCSSGRLRAGSAVATRPSGGEQGSGGGLADRQDCVRRVERLQRGACLHATGSLHTMAVMQSLHRTDGMLRCLAGYVSSCRWQSRIMLAFECKPQAMVYTGTIVETLLSRRCCHMNSRH